MTGTVGTSASMTGDKLEIQNVAPAYPESDPTLGVQGGTETLPGVGQGSLLIREGFQVVGASASQEV